MSIHPEILELIHAELDGIATEKEHARLRDAIAADPEVRDEYRRLVGLAEVLRRVDHEEPPALLVAAVKREIRARRAPPQRGFMRRLSQRWPGGPAAIRYAYAVAAGAVIGILGLQLATGGRFFGPTIQGREATATMAPVAGAQLDLAPAGVQGIATLRPSASGSAIGVDLHGADPVELVLRYDPSQDGGRVEVLVVHGRETNSAGSLRLPKKF
jgi:hypothetical protein